MNNQTPSTQGKSISEPADWKEISELIHSFTTSGLARMPFKRLQLKENPEDSLAQVNDIFCAQEVLIGGIRPHMESLDLFEAWHSRLRKKAVLKTLELKDTRSFCLETIALREAVKIQGSNWAKKIYADLMDAEDQLEAIEQVITPRGEIRSDASPALARLFTEKENLGRQVQQSLDKLIKTHAMENYLQDKYVTTREGRWVLPIKSGLQHSVPGIIHGSSQTKQTVFMEPEQVLPLNNRLREVEVAIEEEIERILIELSNLLAASTLDFQTAKEILLDADQLFALAQWNLQIQGASFIFQDTFQINGIKHPLLQREDQKPVENTFVLNNQKRILILSGPNAGGKTVLLKSVGLACYMALCGLPICAEAGSKLPFLDHFICILGDSQNVGSHLSTFAAHLEKLKRTIDLTGPRSLVLVDEICGATDPEEGAALARSFIEGWIQKNIFCLLTSHLSPLKIGWKIEDPVLCGSMEFDSRTNLPTYHFLAGVSGDSQAIETARRIGVPEGLIQRAFELLSPSKKRELSLKEQLESMQAELSVLKDQLTKEIHAAKQKKDQLEAKLQDFEVSKNMELDKVIRLAQKQITELIDQSKVEQTFKKHSILQDLKNRMPEIIKPAAPIVHNRAAGPSTKEQFAEFYPPGSKVYVGEISADGIVQSTPNAKGEVQVLAKSMRLTLPWTGLKPPHGNKNPTADLVRRSLTGTSVSVGGEDRTIDLRGKTVEEALYDLESALDLATRKQDDRLKIIHGHGTDTLKRAVRTYLSRSVYVKKWNAGAPEQGGDGITWVELES